MLEYVERKHERDSPLWLIFQILVSKSSLLEIAITCSNDQTTSGLQEQRQSNQILFFLCVEILTGKSLPKTFRRFVVISAGMKSTKCWVKFLIKTFLYQPILYSRKFYRI